MPDDVSMRTAAKELGLRPRLLELAVQVGEIRTARGAAEGKCRVPRAELARLKASAGFPHSLDDRLLVVDAAKGAELLGTGPARFAKLARGGCFSPVRFYVNRYRAVVWLYLARELRAFAERRPELLKGSIPRGLRVLLDEGLDFRPRHWRGRRVGQLCRQADGPWERAAARAAVLDADVLSEAVPDSGERAFLASLKPELAMVRSASAATAELAAQLCVATAEDEIFWHRLMLDAEMEEARASRQPHPAETRSRAAEPARAPGPAPGRAMSAGPDAGHGRGALPAPKGSVPDTVPPSGSEKGELRGRQDGLPEGVPCSGRDPDADRRRAHVLSRLRGSRRRPGWWRRGVDVARPAFRTGPHGAT